MSTTVFPISSASASPAARTNQCAVCSFRKLCLPVGLDEEEVSQLDRIIGKRRRVMRDEPLIRMDQPFSNLYAVRFGHFKTAQVNLRGQQQITGFQMAGDLLGLDAIGSGRHGCSAVALDDAEVCEIPFAPLQQMFGQVPVLLQHFHRIMSQEITREQNVMLFLSNMRAEQRFALFLLNLSARYAARGFAANEYQLRMSREEIGDYLGLTIESISRLLSRFKREGWIAVDNRALRLLDRPGLEAIASGAAQDAAERAADTIRPARRAA
ncbi:fumarate/nitrate reduction transcriptional regulator Fnr [Oxalobacteraceae bacterium]|nr:fumarate/nitrate reduction transcriptional regulator Fnr [Oxalobacteraceae bacterium]